MAGDFGYQQVTAVDAVTPKKPTSIPVGANAVVIKPKGGAIRYRTDGAVTASVGMPVEDGGSAVVPIVSQNLQFISQSGTVPEVNLHFIGA